MQGKVIIMLTAWVPQFHPSPCTYEQQKIGVCIGHTNFQLGVLIMGLFWTSIGVGGIRPCSVPFAIDQFDLTTSEGRRGTMTFYNLYYTTQTIILLITQTLFVYIQDSVSWALGFGLICILMFFAIIIFFSGSNIYSYVEPKGSIFSNIAHVLVAAKHKHHLHLPSEEDSSSGDFYDPPLRSNTEVNLPLTNKFR